MEQTEPVVRKRWTSAELRTLVGKKITWEETICRYRGTFRTRSGAVLEVRGKNINVDGDWKWFPSMENMKVVEDEKPTN